MKRIGILALQGGFSAHAASIDAAGGQTVELRHAAQLEEIDGLVIPGGESTTLLNLMEDEPWFDSLRRFHAAGGAIFGTCAGAILLSREVTGPVQPSIQLLDATIQRNAYGRQVDSFETALEVRGLSEPLNAVFIRAPEFTRLGPNVEVLARYRNSAVLVRQGSILAASFHPELTADLRLHRYFLSIVHEPESRKDSRREIEPPSTFDPGAQKRRVIC